MARQLVPLAMILAILLVACAEKSTTDPTTAPSPTDSTTSSTVAPSVTTSSSTIDVPNQSLPPHEKDDLVAILGPIAQPLGYEVSRAALIDRDTYEVTPEGGHLAIYLAPTSDLSPDQFAADLPLISSAFLPFVFDAWPELESFDVCQEPHDSDQVTPPSMTIVDLTREAADRVDWSSIDLRGLIKAADSVDGLSVWARTAIRDSGTWQEAAGT